MSRIRLFLVLSAFGLLTIPSAGCSRQPSGVSNGEPAKQTIRVEGSDTMVNLAQAWAEEYNKTHPGVSVQVSGGGSGVGIASLIDGVADMANASRKMKDKELKRAEQNTGHKPVEFIVGLDALAVYVHGDNPMETISIDELADIYGDGSAVTTWKQLEVDNSGCVSDEITRVSRQNNSGTYHYFREAVLGKARDFKLGSIDQSGSKDVVALVSSTPCAIGYSGMGYKTDDVKWLKISQKKGEAGVAPSVASAADGSYPIARPLHIYTQGEPTGAIKEYLDWIMSPAGQKVVLDLGYVPVAATDTGTTAKEQTVSQAELETDVNGGKKRSAARIVHEALDACEPVIEWIIKLCGWSAILFVFAIFFFVFREGAPILAKLNFVEFFTSPNWRPDSQVREQYGILALMAGTASVTVLAMLIAVPLGLGAAVYVSEFAGPRVKETLKIVIELLAAIPSVVWGFIGIMVLGPLIIDATGAPVGINILNGGIILALMSVPIIVSVSEDSLRAVPDSYREAATALGASRWETVSRVLFPAAKNGLLAAVLLGVGRAIGETMAVLMCTGHAVSIPGSLLDPVRTLTATIAAELGETVSGDAHYQILFVIGIVLFAVAFVVNLTADLVVKGIRSEKT